MRRRIKASFEKNHIEPGNPNRFYVVEPPNAEEVSPSPPPKNTRHPTPPLKPLRSGIAER